MSANFQHETTGRRFGGLIGLCAGLWSGGTSDVSKPVQEYRPKTASKGASASADNQTSPPNFSASASQSISISEQYGGQSDEAKGEQPADSGSPSWLARNLPIGSLLFSPSPWLSALGSKYNGCGAQMVIRDQAAAMNKTIHVMERTAKRQLRPISPLRSFLSTGILP